MYDKYKITSHGYEGFTKLLGKGVDINVFRGEKYMYLVIYGKNRRSVFDLLLENFGFAEYENRRV